MGNLLLAAKGEDGQPKYLIRCEKVKPRVLEVRVYVCLDVCKR